MPHPSNQVLAFRRTFAAAAVLGLFGYGISLMLFVLGLRHLGAARTGAYFDTSTTATTGTIMSLPMRAASLTAIGTGTRPFGTSIRIIRICITAVSMSTPDRAGRKPGNFR